MYYKHNLTYNYHEKCDKHMITVKHLRDTHFDENYEYLEKTRALLVSTLFYDVKLFAKYRDRISETMFENPIHRRIFGYIKECFENGDNVSQSTLLSKFDTKEDVNTASGILALDVQSDDTDRAVSDYINQMIRMLPH